MQSVIVWFRQDLRIEDNPALQAAFETGKPIVPLYLCTPEEEGIWKLGGASRWWLHFSLKSLEEDLASLNLKLVIRHATDSESELKKIAKEVSAGYLFWNRRYEPTAIKKDAQIKVALKKEGLQVESFKAQLLFEPHEIFNKQKKPFQVFTPFWKECLAHQDLLKKPFLKSPKSGNSPLSLHSLKVEDLQLLPAIHWDKGFYSRWKPGRKGAMERLQHFLKKEIFSYHIQRDYPAINGVSELSPHLHFGEISPREVWYAAKACETGASGEALKGIESFMRQLGWREFAHHLLYHFPQTPTQPLRQDFAHFPWDENPTLLKAWQHGKTGYPLVDAGMRQLWKTGWMHNRVRMVVGSFLVKDLLIAWNSGAEWFWDTLVDADLANNTLGWQWVGGCGADAAPYFRVFNPVAQSEKFDADGDYMRTWVPELSKLRNPWIHKPWEAPLEELKRAGVILGETYPHPIVDHKAARERALAAFQKIREKDDENFE